MSATNFFAARKIDRFSWRSRKSHRFAAHSARPKSAASSCRISASACGNNFFRVSCSHTAEAGRISRGALAPQRSTPAQVFCRVTCRGFLLMSSRCVKKFSRACLARRPTLSATLLLPWQPGAAHEEQKARDRVLAGLYIRHFERSEKSLFAPFPLKRMAS